MTRVWPRQAAGSVAIWYALHAVSDLRSKCVERDELWVALWRHATTRGRCEVVARGSGGRVRVSGADASVELIAIWEWLLGHETRARAMPPAELWQTVRSIATRSHRGSARAAMADALCGLTQVPADVHVVFCSDEVLEFRAS